MSTSVSTPLLEREQELSAFDRLLTDAAGGGSGLVVVEGPAGIGKSHLIAALRERAVDAGLGALSAHGSHLERDFPFGVVRQLFEPPLADPGERERLLGGAASSARPVFEALPVGDGGADDVSFAALHGLYWLTVNLSAERPLLLVVDDVHWSDRPSLRFVAYLARRLEGVGVVLAVGLRSTELGTDPVLIGELVEATGAVQLRPRPLGGSGVAELIRSRLAADPDPAFAAACLEATGGNPLLLRQLMSSLEADGVPPKAARAQTVRDVGPRAVSRTVLLRLRRLAPEASDVAQAVAVLGDGADLPKVAALAELGEEVVAAATAALAGAEILLPDPPLGFVHPLVRDAVYHHLPPGERQLRHARAAGLLIEAHAPAEEVATHLLETPRRGEEWVVELLHEAAASARRRGAAESAVAYLERALAEPPPAGRRTQLTLELGLAETLISGTAAAAHLREAWEATRNDPRACALVGATLARTLLFTAPAREAVMVASSAAAATPRELVDERQALRALELMAVFFGAGDPDEFGRLDDVRIDGDGPGAKMLAAITSWGRALTGASAEECVELAGRALADGVPIEADPGLFPVPAIVVQVMADRDEALTALDELRALAYRRGSLLGILTHNLWRGYALLWRGDLREAEEALEAAQEQVAAWGLAPYGATYGPAFLAAARFLRGDLAGARALLEASSVDGREDNTDGGRLLLRSWGELLLLEGRYEEALAVADDLAGRYAFIVHPGWAPWRSLKARALDGLGRTEEALELAGEELALARRFGSPSVVGRPLRLVGELERERGLGHLQEAVALYERSTAREELARTLLALGAALRRARRPTEAREPLRRALELAERCGADGLGERVRSELYATGARPRTAALSGAQSLTASERRVAALAAEGRSNKEIAQALYITPKTVEVHLSNTYRKLGIRSRRGLAGAFTAQEA